MQGLVLAYGSVGNINIEVTGRAETRSEQCGVLPYLSLDIQWLHDRALVEQTMLKFRISYWIDFGTLIKRTSQ